MPLIFLKHILNYYNMKYLLFAFAIISTGLLQNTFAQDSLKSEISPILSSYYKIKDALVKSNINAAAVNSAEFLKAINDTEKTLIPLAFKNSLVNDAVIISQSNDIKVQREKFATLSASLFALAKTIKLSAEPIYQLNCPMKKAIWLSDNKAVKNPYYGSAMLTCGSVKEIL